MNKAELASHVAAETAVPKAGADSVVGAVFAAIAEALARGEKVYIAGFGSFATRTPVQPARAATRVPGKASPSPPPRHRRSRPARRSATPSMRIRTERKVECGPVRRPRGLPATGSVPRLRPSHGKDYSTGMHVRASMSQPRCLRFARAFHARAPAFVPAFRRRLPGPHPGLHRPRAPHVIAQ